MNKYGQVPVAAGAGFIVPKLVVGSTPVGIGGGYIASLLGAQGRRKLAPIREQAAKIAIADLLDAGDDFAAVSPGEVAAVAAQFNVQGDALEEICIDIYKVRSSSSPLCSLCCCPPTRCPAAS